MKRVCLTPTDPRTYGAVYNITIDLMLSEEGVPSGALPAFGVMGGFAEASERSPFILFPDGSGDFGSEWEEDERDFQFNLIGTSRSVTLGELFTLELYEDIVTYRVTQIFEIT